MNKALFILLLISASIGCYSQNYSEQDSLRGSITPERAWWNLTHYDLSVEVDPDKRYFKGQNTISYTVLEKDKVMQIDLQDPMKIDKVIQRGKTLKYKSKGNAHFIKLQADQRKGDQQKLTIYFSGHPREAVNAPWDGGISWEKDNNGKDFIATSNQGLGASIWWPNKDHSYDEPDDGAKIAVTIPKGLMDVSNGRLKEVIDNEMTKTWVWEVVNPINNYGININIGDYVHFGEQFEGLDGTLDLDYYVLRENEEKARFQFLQVPKMMRAFEYWFGPYPFYRDGYKLVEVPYLGMEHQSSVTYGNKFENGYLGRDLSDTGWGLQFDFIIVHESGHEWFANNITNIDVADMWIHESFTAYSENLYLNYHYSDEAASEYVIGTRRLIKNERPIIGPYNVNYSGDIDMYYKGSNVLHTLRQLVEDDKKWRKILRGLNKEFYHKTVSSAQVEAFMGRESGIDLKEFWNQYLRSVNIPKVEYKISGSDLVYRYVQIIENFDMPVVALINGKEEWIYPTNEWKTETYSEKIKTVAIKKDFYVESEELQE